MNLLGNYFVSTYPPFSQWDVAATPAYRAALATSPAEPSTPFGIYVHIPFCVERCDYCYYFAIDRAPRDVMDDYLGALRREAELYAGAAALRDRPVDFAYVGGGTPSLLTPRQIETLIVQLRRCLEWSDGAEITFECAPRSTTRARLAALEDAGVTRLSMGVQQLDDEVLRRSGRVHRVADVERAWERIRATGIGTVNLDLMVGMQGESEASFFRSLDRVIEMGPESVTLYQLEIPLNTPLARSIGVAETPPDLLGWEAKHERLALAFAELEAAGYVVRSGYAAVRDPARHAFRYQDAQYAGADLIGMGVASFSYLGGVHQQNLATMAGYLEVVGNGDLPLGRAYRLDAEAQLVRELILQLKLGGADFASLERRHGMAPEQQFAHTLDQFTASGWLRVHDRHATLTREGLVRIDHLLPAFYPPRYRSVRYS